MGKIESEIERLENMLGKILDKGLNALKKEFGGEIQFLHEETANLRRKCAEFDQEALEEQFVPKEVFFQKISVYEKNLSEAMEVIRAMGEREKQLWECVTKLSEASAGCKPPQVTVQPVPIIQTVQPAEGGGDAASVNLPINGTSPSEALFLP